MADDLLEAHAQGLMTERILLEGINAALMPIRNNRTMLMGGDAFALGRISPQVDDNLAQNEREIMDRMTGRVPPEQVIARTARRRFGY
ncbi:MAG: hypothetical protein Q7R54_02600 [bacterium]|nr:hypothetical protein [bacterium]